MLDFEEEKKGKQGQNETFLRQERYCICLNDNQKKRGRKT